ncbi:hypothetical protein V8C34DRAFT_296815 [Trichoderma compactum]
MDYKSMSVAGFHCACFLFFSYVTFCVFLCLSSPTLISVSPPLSLHFWVFFSSRYRLFASCFGLGATVEVQSFITGVSLGVSFSPYFVSCVPPSLVRQLGIFPRSDAWSLDPSLEPYASSSRGCIQRAVKIASGKGTGIYSCSITDREEYIGAFRWGYCLPWLIGFVHGCLWLLYVA